jgi:hypothetical protein
VNCRSQEVQLFWDGGCTPYAACHGSPANALCSAAPFSESPEKPRPRRTALSFLFLRKRTAFFLAGKNSSVSTTVHHHRPPCGARRGPLAPPPPLPVPPLTARTTRPLPQSTSTPTATAASPSPTPSSSPNQTHHQARTQRTNRPPKPHEESPKIRPAPSQIAPPARDCRESHPQHKFSQAEAPFPGHRKIGSLIGGERRWGRG